MIKKGLINKKALRIVRLNIDDLTMLLREKNTFSVAEVEYAILEPNGKSSVIKKIPDQQVTKADLSINLNNKLYFPSEIIVDGRILKKFDRVQFKSRVVNATITAAEYILGKRSFICTNTERWNTFY